MQKLTNLRTVCALIVSPALFSSLSHLNSATLPRLINILCCFFCLLPCRLHVRPALLTQTLWGDYFLNLKTKRIVPNATAKNKRPLFVQVCASV